MKNYKWIDSLKSTIFIRKIYFSNSSNWRFSIELEKCIHYPMQDRFLTGCRAFMEL